MKPFDLDAALAGEPVVLRDGRKGFVKFRLPGVDDGSWSMSGYRIEKDDSKAITNWRRNGTMYSVPSEADIIGMWEDQLEIVRIGNFEFPKPEVVPLKHGEEYFAADVRYAPDICSYTWEGDSGDRVMLENRVIHKTKEAAILHAKALIAATKGAVNGENHD